ncbi:MAG: hypothetical protein DRJ63_01010 [Thermoprotei archaeon]|nr:MAG: hypothetical protein DRJ63_01010 [Thermoprotei archaeon]
MDLYSNLLLGFIVTLAIGLPSYKKKFVSFSGLFAGLVVGMLTFVGGPACFLVIMVFFLSSSILTKLGYHSKEVKGAAEKKSGRTALQVICAGGVAGVAAFLKGLYEARALIWPDPNQLSHVLTVAFLGAVSSANADTWAVELGLLSEEEPKLITNLKKKVPPGTSGGVTKLGTLGSFLGALLIAAVSAALYQHVSPPFEQMDPLAILIITFISGFTAEKIDSFLGATVQVKYWCPKCKKETDKKVHKCGSSTEYLRGIKIISNEAVNLISTLAGALLASCLYIALYD